MHISILKFFWYALQLVIGYNLVLPLILLFISKLKGKRKEKVSAVDEQTDLDYAVIVTAYQEIVHIPDTVYSLLRQTYNNFLIYVVLDNCKDISSLQFDDERVILLQPEEVLAGNTRSHFYALERFKRAHNVVTIIDSDNIADERYLEELNGYFDKGYSAVQGVRKAKNLDTDIACLDASRDIYYHFYDGKVLYNIGSSATLSGSGMAFKTSVYRGFLTNNDVKGAGFDKVLQFDIVKNDLSIAFAEDAIVYDQKTSNSGQLVNQRARWINTWFKYFGYGFNLSFRGIKKLSSNQFFFGLVLLRPPLFMFLLMSILLLGINLWVDPTLSIIWFVGLLLFVFGFLLALLSEKTDKRIYRALYKIPEFIFYQIKSLLFVKIANKRSVATKHFNA